jgi:hypothetical protein
VLWMALGNFRRGGLDKRSGELGNHEPVARKASA